MHNISSSSASTTGIESSQSTIFSSSSRNTSSNTSSASSKSTSPPRVLSSLKVSKTLSSDKVQDEAVPPQIAPKAGYISPQEVAANNAKALPYLIDTEKLPFLKEEKGIYNSRNENGDRRWRKHLVVCFQKKLSEQRGKFINVFVSSLASPSDGESNFRLLGQRANGDQSRNFSVKILQGKEYDDFSKNWRCINTDILAKDLYLHPANENSCVDDNELLLSSLTDDRVREVFKTLFSSAGPFPWLTFQKVCEYFHYARRMPRAEFDQYMGLRERFFEWNQRIGQGLPCEIEIERVREMVNELLLWGLALVAHERDKNLDEVFEGILEGMGVSEFKLEHEGFVYEVKLKEAKTTEA